MQRVPQANKTYLLIAMRLDFVESDKIFKGTSLTKAMLQDRETIDMSDAIVIVHNIYQYCTIEHWPALLGEHLGASTHGPVGYASLSAATLGQALATFVKWYVIRCECYRVKIIEQMEHMDIVIEDTTADQRYEKFFFEALMRALEVLIHTIMGDVTGIKTEIHFKTAFKNVQMLNSAYDSRLYEMQPKNKMVIPKSYWYLSSPLYDKDSYEFNVSKCRQQYAQMNKSHRLDNAVIDVIKAHFERCINTHQLDKPPPSLKELCDHFHTSERTMIRKLKEYDTSYKGIVEKQRLKFARRLLMEENYLIHQIASFLGYQDSANFTRAFKKWYGQSPSAYKNHANKTNF